MSVNRVVYHSKIYMARISITIKHILYTNFLYTYIKKLFLIAEAGFFPDSNSTSDKREFVY